MAKQTRRITVFGRVQGVGFRYFVQRAASRLGLGGNVRNCDDGSVEILVEGDFQLLEEFQKQVARGPSLARVERLEVEDVKPSGAYQSFFIEGW